MFDFFFFLMKRFGFFCYFSFYVSSLYDVFVTLKIKVYRLLHEFFIDTFFMFLEAIAYLYDTFFWFFCFIFLL